MTLKPIVVALGGDLYGGGVQANVPAPGHSAADRSISLLLSGDRVVVHGFGGADWREARDDLLRRGLIDRGGRLVSGGAGPAGDRSRDRADGPRPDRDLRLRTAARLWAEAVPLGPGQSSARHLARRAVPEAMAASDLRHHPAVAVSVYRDAGPRRTALTAGIRGPDGALTGVELTYLQPNGAPDTALRLPRKTVGIVPPGAAVRLAQAGERLLVAEGVMTTLSAMTWFDLPGWALMSVRNLAVWTPPPPVRRLVIAGDRGGPGEAAAERLRRRLAALGLEAEVRLPEPPFGDWNEAAVAHRKEGGRAGRGAGTAGIGSAVRTETYP